MTYVCCFMSIQKNNKMKIIVAVVAVCFCCVVSLLKFSSLLNSYDLRKCKCWTEYFFFFKCVSRRSLKNDLFTLIWFDPLLWIFALFLPDFSAKQHWLKTETNLCVVVIIYNLVKSNKHWTTKAHYTDSIKLLTSNLNPIQSSKRTVCMVFLKWSIEPVFLFYFFVKKNRINERARVSFDVKILSNFCRPKCPCQNST